MKHLKSSLFSSSRLFGYLLGCSFVAMAACSKSDSVVVCPSVTAPEEGARVFVQADESKQIVDVRFNGVRSSCKAQNDGTIKMEIKAGLKLSRNLNQNALADIVAVPMMTAILDTNDVVISNDVFGYRNGFDKDVAKLYPVAEMDFEVPVGGRIVLSLQPNH
jgi:Fe-S cluster biogenesis protein NfuA